MLQIVEHWDVVRRRMEREGLATDGFVEMWKVAHPASYALKCETTRTSHAADIDRFTITQHRCALAFFPEKSALVHLLL